MNKTLLIVGGGLEAVPGIRTSVAMGLHVVVSDLNPDAPGFAEAHDTLLASTYDVDATVRAAKTYHTTQRAIDGVICMACDVPHTVAHVAEALGLPGISVATAHLAIDKLAMKERLAADGVPVPLFHQVFSPDDILEALLRNGYPMVVKPVDSRGARGVLRLTSDIDPEWAFHESRQHSPSGRVMIEQFLAGPQVSTETLVVEGTAHTVGFSDRNYEYLERFSPYIIENGGELPSRLPDAIQTQIHHLMSRAAASMGIERGVAKGDIVVHEGKPYVIEIAARLSGGYFCTHEIPLNTGVDFVQHAIRIALGESSDPDTLKPRWNRAVVQRYLFAEPPGHVLRVDGVDEVVSHPDVAFADIRVKPGDRVDAVHNHPARAGVIIATGKDRESALKRAQWAVNAITILTDPIGK